MLYNGSAWSGSVIARSSWNWIISMNWNEETCFTLAYSQFNVLIGYATNLIIFARKMKNSNWFQLKFLFFFFYLFCDAGDNNSTNDDTSALLKNLNSSTSFHHSSSLTQQLKSASIAASLNAIATAAAANSQATKLKGKRKSLTGMSNNSNAIDMLNDRLNAADSKRFCESNNSKSIAQNQSNEKRKYQYFLNSNKTILNIQEDDNNWKKCLTCLWWNRK